MDSPTPPQPPAVPDTPAVHDRQLVRQQATYQFKERGRSVTLQVNGDVRPDRHGGLRFASPGAVLTLAISGQQGITTLTWDAEACRLQGQHSGPCSDADKAAAVAALGQLPDVPDPPKVPGA